jgi:hypothetical protein
MCQCFGGTRCLHLQNGTALYYCACSTSLTVNYVQRILTEPHKRYERRGHNFHPHLSEINSTGVYRKFAQWEVAKMRLSAWPSWM